METILKERGLKQGLVGECKLCSEELKRFCRSHLPMCRMVRSAQDARECTHEYVSERAVSVRVCFEQTRRKRLQDIAQLYKSVRINGRLPYPGMYPKQRKQ
jgi:hypothetical protein